MIEQRAVDGFHGDREAARRAKIGIARPGITAWMIMRENDPRAAMRQRVGDDDLHGEVGAMLVARMPRHVDAARLVIGMCDPQLFNARIAVGEATGEE